MTSPGTGFPSDLPHLTKIATNMSTVADVCEAAAEQFVKRDEYVFADRLRKTMLLAREVVTIVDRIIAADAQRAAKHAAAAARATPLPN